jgi:hypothetical protein
MRRMCVRTVFAETKSSAAISVEPARSPGGEYGAAERRAI